MSAKGGYRDGRQHSPSPSPPSPPPAAYNRAGAGVVTDAARGHATNHNSGSSSSSSISNQNSHSNAAAAVHGKSGTASPTPSPSPLVSAEHVHPTHGTAPRRGGYARGDVADGFANNSSNSNSNNNNNSALMEVNPSPGSSGNSSSSSGSSSSNDATSSNVSVPLMNSNNSRKNSRRQQGSHSPSPPPALPAGEGGMPSAGDMAAAMVSASLGPRATTSELYSLQSPSPDACDALSSGSGEDHNEPGSGRRGVVPPLTLGDALRDSSNSNSSASQLQGGGGGGGAAGYARGSSQQEPSPSVPMASLHYPMGGGASISNHNTSTSSPSPPVNLSAVGSMSMSQGSTTSPSPSSGSGSGSFCGNPRRTLNPAFLTLSPRANSEDSQVSDTPLQAAVLRLETDKGEPKVVLQCDMTSLEERKMFVTQQCAVLARKMTATRIVESLLPALLTAFECDDYSESFDNCAPSIAAVLPKVVEALDDRSTNKMKYFVGLIMELCCSAENTVVRDVTASLTRVLALLEDGVVVDLFLPLVLSMRVSFWSTPRAVAAGLLGCLAARPAVVRASEMSVSTWFNCFVESSRDPCVLVREAAVKALHQWIAVANAHGVSYVEVPLPLVKEFVTDDLSDAVRYLLVQELVKLAKLMGRDATSKHLQLVYASACGDPSWRVRFIAATCMGDLIDLVAKPESFVRVLALLAEDEEPEIRAAVARQIPQVSECLPGDAVEAKCVPVALRLGEDMDPVVRGAAVHGYASLLVLDSDEVAKTVCQGIVHLMEDPSFAVQVEAIRSLEHIIRVLEACIQQADARAGQDDETSGGSSSVNKNAGGRSGSGNSKRHRATTSSGGGDKCSDVSSTGSNTNSYSRGYKRLGVAASRQRAALVVQSFVDRLECMSDAGNWRLRDAVVYTLRFFCRAIHEEDFTPLTHVIRVLLRDPVSEVRSRATQTLRVVAEHYGAEWAAQTTVMLLHEEFAPAQQQAYVWRVVAIQCLAVLLPVVHGLGPADLRRQQLLNLTTELLQQYTADAVPNVRIAVAKAMPQWRQWFASSVREQIVFNEAVSRLQHDEDVDVAEAAAAIESIHGHEVASTETDNAESGVTGSVAVSYSDFTTPY